MRKLLLIFLFLVTMPVFAQSSADLSRMRAKKVFDCVTGHIPCAGKTEPAPMGGWIVREPVGDIFVIVAACEKKCEHGEPDLRFDIFDPRKGTVTSWIVDRGPSGEVEETGGTKEVNQVQYARILRAAERQLFPRPTSIRRAR